MKKIYLALIIGMVFIVGVSAGIMADKSLNLKDKISDKKAEKDFKKINKNPESNQGYEIISIVSDGDKVKINIKVILESMEYDDCQAVLLDVNDIDNKNFVDNLLIEERNRCYQEYIDSIEKNDWFDVSEIKEDLK